VLDLLVILRLPPPSGRLFRWKSCNHGHVAGRAFKYLGVAVRDEY